MTQYVGDIGIPYITVFNTDKLAKTPEVIRSLGTSPPTVLEFPSNENIGMMEGSLFQASGDVRSVDQYAEDLQALIDRSAVFNFLHNYQGRTGWLAFNSGGADEKMSDMESIRRYVISGGFLPKNVYQPAFRTNPVILSNDFSLTLGAGGCDNYVPLPIGATYSGGDDATITRVGKDGTTTLVKATTNKDINWDLAADEVDVGECKCWDDMNEASESDWVRVFNPDHVFTGECVIENGLTRLEILLANTDRPIYSYISSAWTLVGADELYERPAAGYNLKFESLNIISITPDSIVINGKGYAFAYPTIKVDVIWTIWRGFYLFKTEIVGASLPRHNLNTQDDNGCIGDKISDKILDSDAIGDSQYSIGINKSKNNLSILCTTLQKQTNISAVPPEIYISNTPSIYRGFIPFANAANLHKECEDMTQGAGVAFYTGVDASPKTGNTGSILDVQTENIHYSFAAGNYIPLGTYKLFVRAKDSAQVANDLSFNVYNDTDSTEVTPITYTIPVLTADWAYYSIDVPFLSDDDGDACRITLKKNTATANTIDLDYVLWVPVTLDSGNGPQDIARQAMVDQRMQRQLVER